MRAALRWSLALTVIASAGAVWWPRSVPTYVAAASRSQDETPAQQLTISGRGEVLVLPGTLQELQIEPARRDPFTVTVPKESLPLARAPVQVAQQVPVPPTAPAPQAKAPPQTMRYLGSITGPDGVRVVMLAQGDAAITIEVGTTLGNGYIVQAIGHESVRLVYPPTSNVVDVPITEPSLSSR